MKPLMYCVWLNIRNLFKKNCNTFNSMEMAYLYQRVILYRVPFLTIILLDNLELPLLVIYFHCFVL